MNRIVDDASQEDRHEMPAEVGVTEPLETCDFAALDRSIAMLEAERDKLCRQGSYDAMFPEGDANSLKKIRDLLRAAPVHDVRYIDGGHWLGAWNDRGAA